MVRPQSFSLLVCSQPSGLQSRCCGRRKPKGKHWRELTGNPYKGGMHMQEKFNLDRRRFFGTMAMTFAAAQLRTFASADAQSNSGEGTHTSFSPLKQINAGLLNVGYAEAGPADGQVVILLHGWPYDIHSYVDVAPILASAGYRVIVPYLRGYGSTRFLSSSTLRNGEQVAGCSGYHCAHGCPQDQEGHPRRF